MIEITYADALDGLKALVAEAGEDFIYSKRGAGDGYSGRCFYVFEGKPDCIVGKYLAKVGVSLDELKKADGRGFGEPADALLDRLEFNDVITIEPKAIALLQEAQYHQDQGNTWGCALRRAVARTS